MKNFIGALFILGSLSLSAFGANIELTKATWVGQTQLQPGVYKVEVKDGKLILKSGKIEAASVPVTTEDAKAKYSNTEVETRDAKVTAIRLGGTAIRILLPAAPMNLTGGGN
jgi:hypothetical protein